jgi:hypothetical protein
MKNNVFLLLFLAHVSIGQTKILHPEAYLQIVRNYHPLAKQASIGIQKSEAQILQARGAFDPILSHYSAQKTLDGKNYFTSQNPELSIPTWYGIELSAILAKPWAKFNIMAYLFPWGKTCSSISGGRRSNKPNS